MIDRVTEEYFTEDFASYKTEKEDGNKEKPRCTAIILAAGSGSRMHSAVAKQFLPLKGTSDLVCIACGRRVKDHR